MRMRICEFVKVTSSNVRGLVDAMERREFSDDNLETVEPMAECMATIFERAAATLRRMVQPCPALPDVPQPPPNETIDMATGKVSTHSP